MQTQYNYNSVFTDFLSVTFNPEQFDLGNIKLLLLGCGYEIDESNPKLIKFNRPDDPLSGLIRVTSKFNHVLISISGKAISYLKKLKQYDNILLHISEFQYRITRLDASMDVPRDFPKICRSIQRYYPDDRIGLSRKTSKVTYDLCKRDDGLRSGSIYMGGIRDQFQILIYDKTLETLDKLGITIPTTTRYEMRFKSSFNLTLRDASDPTELFWSHCDMVLLKKPSGVSQRSPTDDMDGWSREHYPTLPFSKLSSYIDHSTAIDSMIVLADNLGSTGRDILLRLITQRLNSKADSVLEVPPEISAGGVVSRKEGSGTIIPFEALQQSALKQFNNK